MHNRRRDDELIRRVLVETRSLQSRDSLGNGGRDREHGQFLRDRESEEFRQWNGQLKSSQSSGSSAEAAWARSTKPNTLPAAVASP
jgi:hypothetical protein